MEARQFIPAVVEQHVEESAILRNLRSVLVRAPHVKLHQLGRLDERIAAHLDGLAVAGKVGSGLCETALEDPGVGEVFAATVRAIVEKDQQRLARLFALASAAPEAGAGLISAFGWVSASYLQGIVKTLLASADSSHRYIGIAACTLHGADPGPTLGASLNAPEPWLRARARRAAGELGRRDLLAACVAGLQDEDAEARFWAAWTSVLLGERDQAVKTLKTFVSASNPFQSWALSLMLKAIDLPSAQRVLSTIARDPLNRRILIQGAGIAGDAQYLPWLITQMADDSVARLAGESFSMITGLDLAYLDLERKPPEEVEAGPTEDLEDDDVEMDPDDSLPWPDEAKIQRWWAANGQRFQPNVRYFMGAVPTLEHCLRVLKEGYQRQRTAAAEYRCVLSPGTPLFNTRAPAWRQQRWLSRMN